MSGPEIKVRELHEEPRATERKYRQRHSAVFITINTHKTYDPANPESEETVNALRNCVRDVFDKDRLSEYVQIKPSGHTWESNIVRVTLQYRIGTNGKGNRHMIHAHVSFHIVHRSDIHILAGRIKPAIVERLGEGTYVHFKFSNGARDDFFSHFAREYMTHDQV